MLVSLYFSNFFILFCSHWSLVSISVPLHIWRTGCYILVTKFLWVVRRSPSLQEIGMWTLDLSIQLPPIQVIHRLFHTTLLGCTEVFDSVFPVCQRRTKRTLRTRTFRRILSRRYEILWYYPYNVDVWM